MSDLIKREDAMAIAFKSPFFSNALMEEFKTIPTIDAVEVVRRKECIYWKNSLCQAWHRVIPKDGYCSIGERKESE